MLFFTATATAALLITAARPLEFVPAPDPVKAAVIDVWQRAADGDPVWTPRATRAQKAYDTLCAREDGMRSLCRSLGDQARCGMTRGLEPRAVAVSSDGKAAEIVVKMPGDELALFLVRAVRASGGAKTTGSASAWRIDGVRCPPTLDRETDARPVPAVVATAVKSLATKSKAKGAALSQPKKNAPPQIGSAWPAFVDVLPPDPGLANPIWFLPDERCHVVDIAGEAPVVLKPTPAGAFAISKKGVTAVVRNNAGERYLAYFERDASGAMRVADTRCAALPPR